MMSFDTQWTRKVANTLTKQFGSAFRDQILSQVDRTDALTTTRTLLDAMQREMPENRIHDTLTDVSCFYPHEHLESLRELYRKTGDLAQVHAALQHQFETDIVTFKNLSQAQLAHIRKNDWGVAGKLVDTHTIIATKIPSNFDDYAAATTDAERNAAYCHCPRLREHLRAGESIPSTYCYCGGGYYRDIWQFITGKPARVTIEESILKGDPVCRFTIRLEE